MVLFYIFPTIQASEKFPLFYIPHYSTSHVAENLKRIKELNSLDVFNMTVGYLYHN